MQQNPIIGVFDVETLPLPIKGYLWGIHDQYIDHTMIQDSWRMVSWAGSYIGSSKIYSDVMTSKEALNRNSERVVKSARDFIDSCDIVIGHNYDDFDARILNSEILYYNMSPLKYRTIDTLKLIRANFKLPSYKMAYINDYFGITKKVQNEGQALWNKCLKGDKKALSEMLIYNEGDIASTADLFWRIQPYCQGVPNFSTYMKNDGIQSCHCR